MRLPFRLGGRRRLVALASTGALLVSGGVIATTATPAYAQTACEVDFNVNEWGDGNGGFTANLTINNLGDPVDGWELAFTLPGSAQVGQGWSAQWSQTGQDVTAGDMGWNGSLGTGASVDIGFNGTGFAGAPSEFALNGLVCGGTGPGPGEDEPPTVALTSPAAGQEFEEGTDVPLAADVTPGDGDIVEVEFFVNGDSVGTDTTAPYTATASGLAEGSHTASAVATDSNDEEGSDQVSFSVVGEVEPAVQATPGSVSLLVGDSETVNFSLNTAPGGSVTVSVAATGDVSVTPTSFTLDDGNFSAGQDVSVTGEAEGSGTVTASAPGFDDASVSVTVSEDTGPPPERVDNPYEGADLYVNPDWSQAAQDGGAPSEVYNQGTGIWLDTIAAITEGSAGPNFTGLEGHLDQAVMQDQANGSTPVTVQVVIYNLPGRDCSALASNGELGPDELPRYESEYIDVIADIMDRPEYQNLRIATIVEIDSLPNLVTNVDGAGSTELCATMQQNGGYVNGVGYALGTLGDIPNVYNYVDAAHHGWIGWSDNFTPTANIICDAANANGAEPGDVHGLITNTANYSALEEPFIDTNGTINGQQIRQSDWIDFNDYNAELPFAQAFGQEFVSVCGGVDSGLGMLIDTSRNGWGGPERPDGASDATDLNAFVDESRIDRRIHKGNWCNQSGAGIGERPQANPASGIDAYVWIKPPGESDGSSELIPQGPDNPDGKGFDEMCDPEYGGNERNGNNLSGARPDAPPSGHWFQEQFDELLANAWPPLS